jgi:hypothetical protein
LRGLDLRRLGIKSRPSLGDRTPVLQESWHAGLFSKCLPGKTQMNPYNGFTSAERTRALNWLKGEYAAGRRRRPIVCDACGQTEGPIEAHSEDYSFPYGDHIGQYGVCYRCHMMIHCRFKNPGAWADYKAAVRDGCFAAVGRDFYTFLRQTIDAKGRGVEFKALPHKDRTFLDDLTSMSVMSRT